MRLSSATCAAQLVAEPTARSIAPSRKAPNSRAASRCVSVAPGKTVTLRRPPERSRISLAQITPPLPCGYEGPRAVDSFHSVAVACCGAWAAAGRINARATQAVNRTSVERRTAKSVMRARRDASFQRGLLAAKRRIAPVAAIDVAFAARHELRSGRECERQ